MKIVNIFMVLFLLGCTLGTDSGSRKDIDIKLDLSGVELLIPAIKAGLELADEESILNLTRAFNPTSVKIGESALIMSEYFGSDFINNPNTPSQVYTNNSSEIVGGVLRVPSQGFIKGLYDNANNDFYLTLELISGTQYLIKVYIYPRDIFNIDYIYLEYYVDEGNSDGNVNQWAWSWFDNTWTYQNYASEKTYFRDGTYSIRTSTPESGEVLYNEIKSEAPLEGSNIEYLISNITDYNYPASPPLLSTTPTVDSYSSKSTFSVKGDKGDRLIGSEYYTEEGDYSYSVLYMEGSKRKDVNYNVTRYISNRVTGVTNILSLNTDGDFYSEVSRIYSSSTDGVYSSENHIWYTSPINLDISSATSVYNDLSKVGNSYLGTMTQYWGSNGIEYDYSINTISGDITFEWLSNVSRNFENATVISLKDINNMKIAYAASSWDFTFSYELDTLYGVYSYEGVDYKIIMDLQGIEINNTFYNWLE